MKSLDHQEPLEVARQLLGDAGSSGADESASESVGSSGPSVARITITQPGRITVSQIRHGERGPVFRATITREGKPDLDSFGPSPFDALWEAVIQEPGCLSRGGLQIK